MQIIYFSKEARDIERAYLKKLLAKRSITATAKHLKVARNTILSRMDALGMRNGKAK
jgi:transcriptional regulator with PAS, ATPase and Fis domain